MSNRERILRNLEYLGGGMSALKTLGGSDGINARYYELLDEWEETIYDTINLIEEDYENAKNT